MSQAAYPEWPEESAKKRAEKCVAVLFLESLITPSEREKIERRARKEFKQP